MKENIEQNDVLEGIPAIAAFLNLSIEEVRRLHEDGHLPTFIKGNPAQACARKVTLTTYLKVLEAAAEDAEGREPLTITRMEPVGASRTRIWVRFVKHRPCNPTGIYWYRGRRGGPFDQIGFEVEQRTNGQRFVNRPLGEQSAGPWLIDATPDEIPDGVFADAQHNCWPGWTTTSRFYH